MRGRFPRWLVVVAIAASGFIVSPGPAAGQTALPRDEPRRGLIYRGLERRPEGVCRALYEVRHRGVLRGCTHGPDPAPPGVDVQAGAAPAPLTSPTGPVTAAEPGAGARCDGDGTTGYRVQVIYAVASDRVDRYATYANSIRQWALAADDVVNASAAETGGTRHVRFVHDGVCQPIVTKVVLTPEGDDTLTLTTNELAAQGFNRRDRKYLVWADAVKYCGIANLWFDDQPGVGNLNNGNPLSPPDVGRIDAGCWGQSNSVEAHELGHLLGSVQTSAPHGTNAFHCTDESDRMCYVDESGSPTQNLCPNTAHENRFDCNHDDYFHTSPPAGSYLADHWNTANSRFLTPAGVTTLSTRSVDAGAAVTASATGAPTAGVPYVVKIASTVAGCPQGTQISGLVSANANRDIPGVRAVIPDSITSGVRYVCFARASNAFDNVSPTPVTVV